MLTKVEAKVAPRDQCKVCMHEVDKVGILSCPSILTATAADDDYRDSSPVGWAKGLEN